MTIFSPAPEQKDLQQLTEAISELDLEKVKSFFPRCNSIINERVKNPYLRSGIYTLISLLHLAVLVPTRDISKVENIVGFLLQVPGIDPNLVESLQHDTPLHFAVQSGSPALVKLLLNHPGTDKYITNNNGKTAAAKAKELEREDLAQLIENGRGSHLVSLLIQRTFPTKPKTSIPPENPYVSFKF
ncbi:MAG: ankyrin repeat domain-containing protein [Gammaproteobacteria bacterium]|jgi:hypothetical protein